MHIVNKMLSFAGLRLSKASIIPASFEFIRKYDDGLKKCRSLAGEFEVFKDFHYDAGEHPASFVDFECAFAAQHLYTAKPNMVLDVGSYRIFILGLLANSQVTTIDVRKRDRIADNEFVVSEDAKALSLHSNSFDAVVSLCAIEHFGLGRYGDEFDIDGDKKAFQEMVRVLKPGGSLIFSTTITRSRPSIVFNGHRIYNHAMIHSFCKGLRLKEEKYFSHHSGDFCSLEEITSQPKKWDVYCGCWIKL